VPGSDSTDLYLTDRDRDGLDDGWEDANGNGILHDAGETDPRHRASDSDQCEDEIEDLFGYSPLDALSRPNPYVEDEGWPLLGLQRIPQEKEGIGPVRSLPRCGLYHEP
jgi:hypothetical protein